LRKNIRHKCSDKWPNNSCVLHHDNPPAHASLNVQQFLASMNTTVIPPLSLLTRLCPPIFFLFPKMKLKLKGRCFDSIKEIQTISQNVMKTLTQYDFQKCFQSWKSHWNHCINAKGTTSKGMGVNRNFSKWLRYSRGISGTFG